MFALKNQQIADCVRDLIVKITGFPADSEQYIQAEKHITGLINKNNTPFFISRNEADREIEKMAEKYMFHSFFKHAKYLKTVYGRYIGDSKSTELTNRLNVVKFMLLMSNRPTEEFCNHPEKFSFLETESGDEENAEGIDWGRYLNEGIDIDYPQLDTTSSISDSDESDFSIDAGYLGVVKSSPVRIQAGGDALQPYNFAESVENFKKMVRQTWECCPTSTDPEALVAITWHQFLCKITGGLVEIEKPFIISEYVVMREIIWQLSNPHDSIVFNLVGNKLDVNGNVTISSVRQPTFASCIRQNFLPIIEILHKFKKFETKLNDIKSTKIPITYRSYLRGILEIIEPCWKQIIDLEMEIAKQETTWTLIKLSHRFNEIFEPVFILKKIHEQIKVRDYEKLSSLEASLRLISNQRIGLKLCSSQIEWNIRLTLYLHTLRHYFNTLQKWFVHSDCLFYMEEFLLVNGNTINTKTCDNENVNIYLAPNVEDYFEKDGLLKVLGTEGLTIARNIQLLRLLDKYHSYATEETIYETFLRLFLSEISIFNDLEIIQPDFQAEETNNNIDNLNLFANLEDFDDPFMLEAFKLCLKPENPRKKQELNLFETIQNRCKKFFPIRNRPETILVDILKENFTVSGLIVKNLLVENYKIDDDLNFLNYIFLFTNNLTVNFCTKLFKKLNKNKQHWRYTWAYAPELTSSFHDCILDEFPELYTKSIVRVHKTYFNCEDSVQRCDLIKIDYDINWPLNLVITKEHMKKYEELFNVILKVKWAKFTLNTLQFKELSRRNKIIANQLIGIRFNLLSLFSTLNTYIFINIEHYKQQYEINFEKSNDLQSIIISQTCYINGIYELISKINKNQNFLHVLTTVKTLLELWNCNDEIFPVDVLDCYKNYQVYEKNLRKLISHSEN